MSKQRMAARERLELLFDPGTFEEIDSLVLPRHDTYWGGKESRNGEGVVTAVHVTPGQTVGGKEGLGRSVNGNQ